jgi:hypothetical protein
LSEGKPTREDLESLKANLSPRELQAYDSCVRQNKPPVAEMVADSFYQMYLAGASCAEIQKSNQGFTLGQIVRCRLDGNWDVLRAEHQAKLYAGVTDAVRQAQMESVKFLALRMAASHKFHTEKLLKFIQTGDEKLIDGLGIKDFKQYQETLATLMKVTGQDIQKVAVSGSVEHSLSDAVKGILSPARAPTPEEAELVIKGLLEGDIDEDKEKP